MEKENKNKVLYQIGHYGFLINAFLHKLIYHKNDEAVFIVDKVIMGDVSVEFLEKEKSRFNYLGNIYLYNDRDLINKYKTVHDMENGIDLYFNDFCDRNQLNLDSFSEIYSIFDTFNAFGVYLTRQKIKFNMIESIKNQCQNHDRYIANNLSSPYGATIFKYLALSSDNCYVKKLYCNQNAIVKDKPFEENINAIQLLNRIQKDDVKTLIDCYNVDYIKDQEYMCYMPNSGYIANVYFGLPRIYYMLPNQIILDFFMDSKYKLLVKPHPNTDFTKQTWINYLGDLDLIQGYVPSLLLNYIEDLKIKKILSTGTTGVDVSKSSSINLPINTLYSYKNLYKLYFSILLAKELNIDSSKFLFSGMHEDVVDSFLKKFFDKNCILNSCNFKDFDNNFIFIDDINWGNKNRKEDLKNYLSALNDNTIVVFFNSKNDYSFINKDCKSIDNIVQITLTKTKIRENSLEDLGDENIFVFCKNNEILSKVRDFKCEKVFDYVGVNIKAKESENYETNIIKNSLLQANDFNLNLDQVPVGCIKYLNSVSCTFLIDNLVDNRDNYHFYGINKEFLVNYKNNNFSKFKDNNPYGINPSILKGNIFTIIGDYSDEVANNLQDALINADLDTKVVFWNLNYKNLITFKNIDLLKYFVPITIKKEALRNDTLSDLKEETIYFFCKNEEIRNKVANFTYTKELKNTGIKTIVDNNPQIQQQKLQDIKINILTQKIKEQEIELLGLKQYVLNNK